MIARFIDTRHRLAKAGGAAKAVALLTLTGWAAGFAISAHALTPADNREIQRFTLTESFLHRYAAAAADARSQTSDDSDASPDPEKTMTSLDSMIAEINKSPAKVALLQRHGLTAREAAVGGLVLLRVRVADALSDDPNMAKFVNASTIPRRANMAFYRAHKAEIAKIMTDDD